MCDFLKVFGFAAVQEASKFVQVECGAVIGRLWRLLRPQGLGPSKPSYEAARIMAYYSDLCVAVQRH